MNWVGVERNKQRQQNVGICFVSVLYDDPCITLNENLQF